VTNYLKQRVDHNPIDPTAEHLRRIGNENSVNHCNSSLAAEYLKNRSSQRRWHLEAKQIPYHIYVDGSLSQADRSRVTGQHTMPMLYCHIDLYHGSPDDQLWTHRVTDNPVNATGRLLLLDEHEVAQVVNVAHRLVEWQFELCPKAFACIVPFMRLWQWYTGLASKGGGGSNGATMSSTPSMVI
jgi:hypothetical protein